MKKEHFLQSEGFKTVAASVLSILIGPVSYTHLTLPTIGVV